MMRIYFHNNKKNNFEKVALIKFHILDYYLKLKYLKLQGYQN